MADQKITKHTPEGSFLLHSESPIVCFDSGFLSAPAGAGADRLDLVGYPVTGSAAAGFVLALEADSLSGITGFVCEDGYLDLVANATTERKMKILLAGPAAINEDVLPAKDIAGTDFTAANVVAAAEALGITVRDEQEKQSVQTT